MGDKGKKDKEKSKKQKTAKQQRKAKRKQEKQQERNPVTDNVTRIPPHSWGQHRRIP